MRAAVRFVGKPWPNHSAHSGYHQLAAHLGTEVPMPDTSRFWNTLFPGRLAVWLARRSGVAHYSYLAFYHEWAAAKEMLGLRQRTIYHILYGDQFFRYLGRMRLSRRARIVATFHMPPRRLTESLTTVEHLKTLDAAIVVGSNQAPYFRRVMGESRVHVVPHGVDTRAFKPAEEPEREEKTRHRCLFVGMHERDFETLAEVIDIIGRKDPGIEFTMVSAKEMVAAFGERPNVECYSGISEQALIALYRRADLLIQPLLDSTANNAILEGLACGLPVVVSNSGAVADYLTERCAIRVRQDRAREMVDAVLGLLRDEGRRRSMAMEARKQALRFDWPVIAAQMSEIYGGLA